MFVVNWLLVVNCFLCTYVCAAAHRFKKILMHIAHWLLPQIELKGQKKSLIEFVPKMLSVTEKAKIKSVIMNPNDQTTSFPVLLHKMLSDIDALAKADKNLQKLKLVVSWLPHGRSFKVHDTKKFVDQVMPM